jgi:hypothetical protein
MENIIGIFDPEHVLSLILFLSFVGVGAFFMRNWGDVRDLIKARIDTGKEVQLARIKADQSVSEKLSDLADAMAQHTLQSSKMEAKLSVLIESLDRLYRELLNGKSKGGTDSRG